MDGGTWYVRVRGQINGPYTLDQLKSLCKQRKLGRAHEISEDGQTWQAAGKLQELFPPVQRPVVQANPTVSAKPVVNDSEELGLESPLETEAASPISPALKPQWYYANEGQQLGPVSNADLKKLVAISQVLPETLIWREGMSDWLPANSLPELFATDPVDSREMLPFIQPPVSQPHIQGPTDHMQIEPHRAGLILTLGIIGLFIPIVGIPAWIMGNSDLAKINKGTMDPSGKGQTKTGMVLGIIDTGWMLLVFLIGISNA